jgi:hypothetical protein
MAAVLLWFMFAFCLDFQLFCSCRNQHPFFSHIYARPLNKTKKEMHRKRVKEQKLNYYLGLPLSYSNSKEPISLSKVGLGI